MRPDMCPRTYPPGYYTLYSLSKKVMGIIAQQAYQNMRNGELDVLQNESSPTH